MNIVVGSSWCVIYLIIQIKRALILGQLSGIGDQKQLGRFGIDTVVNLPGVGKNLQGTLNSRE
jgi:hypothetical protein